MRNPYPATPVYVIWGLLIFLFLASHGAKAYQDMQQPAPRVRGGDVTHAGVFLGWMKYAAHVQIRFLNGGHTTYGREQMKDITKELEAGLKCVQERK